MSSKNSVAFDSISFEAAATQTQQQQYLYTTQGQVCWNLVMNE